jgi:hypothetical protein
MSNKKYVATDITGLTPATVGTLPVWNGVAFANLPVGADGDTLLADSSALLGVLYGTAAPPTDPYLIINSGPPDSGFFGFAGDVLLAPEPGTAAQPAVRYLAPTDSESLGQFVIGPPVRETLTPWTLTTVKNEANVTLVLSPKGSGALQAQIADSTEVGGNPRGLFAVDWQMDRAQADQVASGDYSVVGGGRNNRASGFASTVSGGDANVASGDYSTVAGGLNNAASGDYSTVMGGEANMATGDSSVILGGLNNLASGDYSAVGGGENNTASAPYSVVPGGLDGLADRYAMLAHASGAFAAQGDAQYARMILRCETTDATPTPLTADAAAPTALTMLTLADDETDYVEVQVTAREDATGDMAWWRFDACVDRAIGVASTAMVGPISKTTASDVGAATWDVVLSADGVLGGLQVVATGEAGKTIRWVATVHATKVQG